MSKINNIINQNIEKLFFYYILIQPFLDIITGINLNIFNNTFPFAPIIRLLFMLICLYYSFFITPQKSDRKKILIIIAYMIIFVLTMLYKGKNAIIYEITNLINAFYLPIVLIGISKIFNEKNLKIELETIVKYYLMYIVLVALPNLTGTAFNSYSYAKIGHVGWFPLANVIGNLLCIGIPFVIFFIINLKKKYFFKFVIITLILYTFASIGTKVPILGLGICIITNMIYIIIKWIKEKKCKNIIIVSLITIIMTIMSTFIIPKTSFYKNLEIHKEFLNINNYSEIFTRYDLIDHFIFSQRLTFLNTIRKSNNTNIIQKLFGIGYIKKYDDEISTKTIEIDFFDIFYENGIIGTLIFIYILLPNIINALKKCKKISLLNINLKLSIILIILISFFAGHVFISPAIGIFVAIIINIIGGINENIKERQN